MPKRTLEDSRVLITGASRGIGRELALAFAKRQARLVLFARGERKLREVAHRCHELGATTHCCVGDVAKPADRARVIHQIEATWHSLDILVNNAGVSAHGLFSRSEESVLRRIMEVNFFAPIELIRGTLPLLRRGRQPAIVNISSVLGHRGVPHNSEYSASKFALRGFSEALRGELARSGVDVLLVSPGTTDTQFFDHLIARQGDLPWGKTSGISPQVVARRTLSALERGRGECFPDWRGRMLVLASRIFPRLVDRWMRQYGE
jgi:short-subunit dehydrogenase